MEFEKGVIKQKEKKNQQNHDSKIEEKRSLYPERASANITKQVDFLHDIETGKIGKKELTEEEQNEILAFESQFGEKLENIFEMKSKEGIFSVEYFLTKEGKTDFFEVVGEEFEANDLQEAKVFLYEKRKALAKTDSKKRAALNGRSKRFENERVTQELIESISENGELNFDGIEMPERISLLYNPEEVLAKILALRELQETVNVSLKDDDLKKEDNNKAYAKKGILEIYLRKINQMIVAVRDIAVGLQGLKTCLGEGSLLEENEEAIISQFVGLKGGDRNIARLDKFTHGASLEYDETGNRIQINEEIKEFLKRSEEESIKSQLEKEEKIKEKSLDPKKLFEKNISQAEFVSYAEETLKNYGLLSQEDPSDYSVDRVGTASDGGWQVIAREEDRSMEVIGKQQVVKSGIDKIDIVRALSVLISHEIEGHVLQNDNRKKIPLKIFDKVGADRTEIFAEGGAMMNQTQMTKELFGFDSAAGPHYVAAMMKKLDGENYLECTKAFFESAIKVPTMNKKMGKINQEKFDDLVGEKMKLAVNRTERLFRGGADYNSKESFLAKSKDTVYVEQLMLMQKLKQKGLEKYAFLGGSNLKSLAFLAETGLVDLKDIQEPQGYAREIWDRIKDNYKLEAEEK